MESHSSTPFVARATWAHRNQAEPVFKGGWSRSQWQERQACKVVPVAGVQSRIKSCQVVSRRVESSRVEACRVESNRVESSRVESSRVESSRVESCPVASRRVESCKVVSSHVKSNRGPVKEGRSKGGPILGHGVDVEMCVMHAVTGVGSGSATSNILCCVAGHVVAPKQPDPTCVMLPQVSDLNTHVHPAATGVGSGSRGASCCHRCWI